MVYEEFLERWRLAGYENIKMNLWKERRLYLNIKKEATIWYVLDSHIEGTCELHSVGRLSNRLWDEARKQGFWLWKHCRQIKEELKDGRCIIGR